MPILSDLTTADNDPEEDTIAFDDAIWEAVAFAKRHPAETIIVVTGDHECGGMTLGFAATGYDTFYEVVANQDIAYEDFENVILEDYSARKGSAVADDIDGDMWQIILDHFGMDGAASLDEVHQKKPDLGFRDLLASGMAVGRSVVGMMTTTLLLAYSGGYTAMMMNFMSQGLRLDHVFNLNFVASEILNNFVGSFGLVAVASLTAIIGAALYGLPRNRRGSSSVAVNTGR